MRHSGLQSESNLHQRHSQIVPELCLFFPVIPVNYYFWKVIAIAKFCCFISVSLPTDINFRLTSETRAAERVGFSLHTWGSVTKIQISSRSAEDAFRNVPPLPHMAWGRGGEMGRKIVCSYRLIGRVIGFIELITWLWGVRPANCQLIYIRCIELYILELICMVCNVHISFCTFPPWNVCFLLPHVDSFSLFLFCLLLVVQPRIWCWSRCEFLENGDLVSKLLNY